MSVAGAAPTAPAVADEAAPAATSRLVLGALGVVLLAGAALRILAIVERSHRISADQHAYALLALYISEHGHYGGAALSDAFHWPPGAPLLFALANLFDPARLNILRPDIPAAYVAQALVGVGAIALAFALGRRLHGARAGLLAAAAVALYPPLWRSAGELLSEPLGVALLLGALLALASAVGRRDARRAAVSGLLFGALVLTRADLLLAPLVVGLVVLVAVRGREGRVVAGALVGAAILPVAVWTALALASSNHRLVIASTGGASNLFIGTYLPGHGSVFGFKHALGPAAERARPALRGTPIFRLRAQDVLLYVDGHRHGAKADAYLRSRALHDIGHELTHQPAAFAGMLATKAGRLWLDYTRGSTGRPRTWERVLHWLLVAVALAGVLLALARRPRDAVVIAIAALLVFATLVNAVFISEPRHLLPLLPALFTAGAAGLTGWWAARRPAGRGAPAA